MRFLVRRRLDGSPCVPYGAVLEVRPKGQRYLGAGASSHYAACMRAHANAHSKGYPFARSVTPSPRMTWQHIDLCEADSMLADNVALELLLPQHEA